MADETLLMRLGLPAEPETLTTDDAFYWLVTLEGIIHTLRKRIDVAVAAGDATARERYAGCLKPCYLYQQRITDRPARKRWMALGGGILTLRVPASALTLYDTALDEHFAAQDFAAQPTRRVH